jgi:hypothetical protein
MVRPPAQAAYAPIVSGQIALIGAQNTQIEHQATR